MSARRRSPGLGILLLASQIFQVGIDRIPPVTLGIIAAQVAVFLRLVNLPWSTWEACVSAEKVWRQLQWKPLVLSVIEHGDDWHLYYNMVSFLWKGISLETRFGSRKFAVIIAVFSISTGVVYVALGELLARVLEDWSYVKQCAVGFSGVIFAVKVLSTHYSSQEVAYVSGFAVPVKWAVWLELGLIQLMVPNASFVGHLAGILVGLAYIHGPLKGVVRAIDDILAQTIGGTRRHNYQGYYTNPNPEHLRRHRMYYYE